MYSAMYKLGNRIEVNFYVSTLLVNFNIMKMFTLDGATLQARPRSESSRRVSATLPPFVQINTWENTTLTGHFFLFWHICDGRPSSFLRPSTTAFLLLFPFLDLCPLPRQEENAAQKSRRRREENSPGATGQ